jgi:hypothetical protein
MRDHFKVVRAQGWKQVLVRIWLFCKVDHEV